MTSRSSVVLVTGAARGIGADLTRVLAHRGHRLALVGLEPELLAARTAELGPGHRWFCADVRDQAALNEAVSGTLDAFGRLDVCVANAGVANFGTVATGDPDAWARCVDVNLVGAMRTAHAALPALLETRGYLLVVCSLASFAASPGLSGYCASKAGAEQLAIALRREVSFRGVAVGTAHPAWVATDLVRDAESDLPSFRTMRNALPWPASRTISRKACAEAFADGVERRAARIYAPRSLALVQWTRSAINSSLADRVLHRRAGTLVPALEREVAALGRSFGRRTDPLA